MNRLLSRKWIKAPLFLLCLSPLAWLVWQGFHQGLGANPIEKITHTTGDSTLTFLLITLSITPLRKLLNQPAWIRFRRMLGLFAFFYGSLHFMTYLVLDQFFDFPGIVKDVAKRPFITAGFTGFLLLIPLAITSTAGWIRRLGGKRWQMLHSLIYISASAGVVHYYWLVKSDVTKPVRYGAVLAFLLVFRIAIRLQGKFTRVSPYRYPQDLSTTEMS